MVGLDVGLDVTVGLDGVELDVAGLDIGLVLGNIDSELGEDVLSGLLLVTENSSLSAKLLRGLKIVHRKGKRRNISEPYSTWGSQANRMQSSPNRLV